VPRPLIEKMADHGCLVLPLEAVDLQALVRIRQDGGR
jgi:protein-L-isoaspartate O-methyltransferase